MVQTQPDGTVIAHTYNEAGLLETVKKDTETYVSNINYNEKGQRTAIYYGNGSKTKYEYDPNTFRLTRLLTTRNAGQDILQDLNYTYDPVGNIVEVVDNAQQIHYFSNSVIEPKGMYKYDALYRLKEATGRELTSLQLPTHEDLPDNIGLPNTASNAMQNYTQQYTYDELGNILQMKSVGNWTRNYFYNINDNKLLGHTDGTTEYTYDAHGNMLSMPHLQSLIWDFKDELKEVTLNASGDKAYYVYDASGNRVRKVVVKSNIVEERFYLGDYEVFRKTNTGTLEIERSTVFISDDQKRIAMIDNDGTIETIRYQYDNHLGSASLELDESAAIISYEEYHPFGTTSYRASRSDTETSLKRYKYVGKERDEETGLYYYGARYYASWIARFVSVDPLQHDYPIYTPYQYAGNKPISYIDLDGLEEKSPPLLDYAEKVKPVGSDPAAFVHNTLVSMYNQVAGLANYVYAEFKDSGSQPSLAIMATESLKALENFSVYDFRDRDFQEDFVGNIGLGVLTRQTFKAIKGKSVGKMNFKPHSLVDEYKLMNSVESEAKRLIETTSKKQRGPVVSGVLDTKSGKIFYGTNKPIEIENLHPILQKRLNTLNSRTNSMGNRPDYINEIPGSHAEIDALNKALNARGGDIMESELSDFLMHNRALKGERKSFGSFDRCSDCNELTKGVKMVGHD